MPVDLHAHLDFKDYEKDLDQVIQSAGTAGVGLILTCGIDDESSQRALSIAGRHASVYAAAGFHPHEASKAGPGYLDGLKKILSRPRVPAVGEIGLDFHYDRSPRETQEKVFEEQLDLAVSLEKPVMIHSRAAEERAFEMARAVGVKKAMFHCFTGNAELGRRIQSAGYFIGVTGIVTFSNPSNARMVSQLDPEMLITETDCPFLAPKPFRGKRCEPSYIPLILNKLAEIFPGRTHQELDARIERNAKELLGL